MRTIRIRTFIMLCFFIMMTVPWLFYLTAHYMETQSLSLTREYPQDRMQQKQLAEIIGLIEAEQDRWRDPDWQKQLDVQLRQAKLEATIQLASGQEIYRSYPESHRAMSSIERITVIEDGQMLGKAVIYLPRSNSVKAVAIVAGLLLASFIIGMQMRRFLLKPLERMSLAARQIAAGDWDAALPPSRITEITEVRDGFDVMVKGLQQSVQQQVKLEDERRFVIAAVAHDLRTPLFALRGYLDGLEQGIAKSPEQITKYLAVCKEKSAQLDRLVEDLFTFTKMEYVQVKLHNKTIDFTRVIQQSIDSLSPLARQKHISVSNYAADGCFIRGDMHLLERSINNLLDNAVRHTPPYGEIVIQCNAEHDQVKFSIRDTGPGFKPEELQRVFDPLYRGEASRNRSTGGSGLGLTISRSIINRHGGELAAGNHPEGGALLSGWIPANG